MADVLPIATDAFIAGQHRTGTRSEPHKSRDLPIRLDVASRKSGVRLRSVLLRALVAKASIAPRSENLHRPPPTLAIRIGSGDPVDECVGSCWPRVHSEVLETAEPQRFVVRDGALKREAEQRSSRSGKTFHRLHDRRPPRGWLVRGVIVTEYPLRGHVEQLLPLRLVGGPDGRVPNCVRTGHIPEPGDDRRHRVYAEPPRSLFAHREVRQVGRSKRFLGQPAPRRTRQQPPSRRRDSRALAYAPSNRRPEVWRDVSSAVDAESLWRPMRSVHGFTELQVVDDHRDRLKKLEALLLLRYMRDEPPYRLAALGVVVDVVPVQVQPCLDQRRQDHAGTSAHVFIDRVST